MSISSRLCCNHLFPFFDLQPDADYIMSILAPELSEKRSYRRATENSIINFLQDFLQELEVTGLTLSLLQVLTHTFISLSFIYLFIK